MVIMTFRNGAIILLLLIVFRLLFLIAYVHNHQTTSTHQPVPALVSMIAVPCNIFRHQLPTISLAVKRRFMNYVFNWVSDKRRAEVGPDRACAEWLMRNGAYVKWIGQSEFVPHYNLLPLDKKIEGTFYIEEVKAESSSCIMYYGFRHFDGCKHIQKITFNNVKTIDDRAIKRLDYLKHSLKYLIIDSCSNVTEKSLQYLTQLQNLELLHLKGLTFKDISILEDKLHPNCKILVE